MSTSANIFSGGANVPLPESDVGGFHEHVLEGEMGARPLAAPQVGLDPNLLPFDVAQAAREPQNFGAGFDRIMDVNEARGKLSTLMERRGVNTQIEGVQMAFFNAMLLAHAKNSASVQMPGRADFYIGDDPNEPDNRFNFYLDVVDILGDDTRRFFRAYADYSVKMLLDLLAQSGTLDRKKQRDIADIKWAARSRGLERAPELVPDSAEACTRLTPAQYRLIDMSKESVLSKSLNTVDHQVVRRVPGKAPSVAASEGPYSGPVFT